MSFYRTLGAAALGLSLLFAAPGPSGGTAMEIDAKQTGDVISPLLFGHNLEVTRRCIYGGLSAEMVSNRKFAALQDGLPKHWTAISASTTLTVDSDVNYAGRPSLRVTDDGTGGLSQQIDAPLFPKGAFSHSDMAEDYGSDTGGLLAFQKGRKYTFRWQLRTDASDKKVWMRITDTSGTRVIAKPPTTLKPGEWHTWTGHFTASETLENARLEFGSTTAGSVWVGAASVQPSDAFHGMRRDVIARLKELKPGALRFPGGCYSDYYNWRDGLLPVDERPVIDGRSLQFLLPDTDGYDTQEIGIDEFMALCRELKCEPALSVRVWNVPGEPEEAVAWVEYCNGSPDTNWGKMRAGRGHREPYAVKTWFVGNELVLFGRNGLNQAANSVPRTKLFAEAMKKADPSIKLVASSDFTGDGTHEWDRNMMEQAGDLLTYGSFHSYVWAKPTPCEVREVAKASVGIGSACRTFSNNIGKQVTLDEWNTIWGRKGNAATAVYTASMLNRLCRDSNRLGIAQAYYFQSVNEGAVRVTPVDAVLEGTGQVFALFSPHQGARLIDLPQQPEDSDLDVCASESLDGNIFVTAVNRNCDREMPLSLVLRGASPKLKAQLKMLVPKSLENTQTEMIETSERLQVKDGAVEKVLPPCALVRIVFSRG